MSAMKEVMGQRRSTRLTFSERALVAWMAVFCVVVIGAFALNFWRQPFSPESGNWGEFGDYVGGLLNPFMALAALMLLSRSVEIQRTELADSRAALLDQAESSGRMANVAALTALLEASVEKSKLARDERNYLLGGIERQEDEAEDIRRRSPTSPKPLPDSVYPIRGLDGHQIHSDAARERVKELSAEIARLKEAQTLMEMRIEALLRDQPWDLDEKAI